MNNPLVSIIVISYNHSSFIKKCLISLLDQNFEYPFEIVLSDDASTDNTVEAISELLYDHPKKDVVRCFFQKQNLGIRGNIEFVLRECRGEYIAICEGDDYWVRKDKLSVQFSELQNNPEYSAVFTHVEIVDNNDIKLPNYYGIPPKDLLNTNDLIWRHYIPTCTYFFRSTIIKEAAFFNTPIINDRYIEMASSLLGLVKFIPTVTAVHIKHPGGASVNKYSRSKRFHHNFLLYQSVKFFFKESGGDFQQFNFKLFACSARLALHSFKHLEIKNGIKYSGKCMLLFLESPLKFIRGYNASF